MNILGWPNYHILSVDEREHDYQITAEQEAVSLCCPHCGSLSLYRHEVKQQLFLDIPIRGKRTALLIIRKRYRCRSCNKTFYEPLEAMNEHHMMTKRLVNYIAGQSLRRTFEASPMTPALMSVPFAVFSRKPTNTQKPASPLIAPVSALMKFTCFTSPVA